MGSTQLQSLEATYPLTRGEHSRLTGKPEENLLFTLNGPGIMAMGCHSKLLAFSNLDADDILAVIIHQS